jgi:hypothetical protein
MKAARRARDEILQRTAWPVVMKRPAPGRFAVHSAELLYVQLTKGWQTGYLQKDGC